MTPPSTPADPSRPVPPTVREIAALTARLRDLSARGAGVDPAERAAFLADKHALIDRITTGLPDMPASAGNDRHAPVRQDADAHGEYDHAPHDLEQPARADRAPTTAVAVEQAHRAAACLPEPRSAATSEQERRDQLAAWHADDQAAGHGAREDARTVRGPDPAAVREW